MQGCFPLSFYKSIYDASNNESISNSLEITAAIKNLPFAIQILQHQNVTSLLVLGYDDENRLSFIDGDENIFTFFHGKVIDSTNLDNNIEIKNPPNLKNVFLNLLNSKEALLKHESLIRFSNPKTSYLSLKTEYLLLAEPNKLFRRMIDGEELAYFILEEKFEVSEILWNGKNTYWFSKDGDILKSKQMIFPDKPKYFFETLKMYVKN